MAGGTRETTAPARAWTFPAIGTTWAIDTPRPPSASVRERVAARIEAYDAAWSRFRTDSVVEAIRTRPGAHRMPPEAGPLLETYTRLHAATAGAMSPAIGASLEHLGYDAAYGLRPGPGHRPAPHWQSVRWDEPFLHTGEPFVLDVGAAGKGQLADLVAAEVLAAQGAEGTEQAVTVNASGDLVHRPLPGAPALRVALEHPERPGRAVGVAELDGGAQHRALCASATNRRVWGPEGARVHHVLDARSGVPVDDVLATWVVAPSALLADALSTALFFLDADAARALAETEGVSFVRLDRAESTTHPQGRRLVVSADFPGEVFA